MDAYKKTPVQTLVTFARFVILLAVLAFGFQPYVTVQAADQVVMNTNNSGAGSLRQAIANVGNGESITFNLSSYPATITLSSELTIAKNLTIIGPGADQLAISGNNASRVFNVSSGTVIITDLTVRSGFTSMDGGGIYNTASLTLQNCVVTNNRADGYGGGIENSGTLIIDNSIISNNSTLSTSGDGGGLDNYQGTVTINNSTISGNISNNAGGGIDNVDGDLEINESTISENHGNDSGGGIYNAGGSTLIINTSAISNNTGDYGGGIQNYNSSVEINNSTINENTSVNAGGGINNGGYSNTPTVVINNSTISGNSGIYGGGIENGFVLIINNSTITANEATVGGGQGGGIDNFGASATTDYKNTIIYGNTATLNGFDCINTSGTITSHGYNLLASGTECPTIGTDQIGNPLLYALAENGGPTKTHALQPGSPAIGHGHTVNGGTSSGGCLDIDNNLVNTDQRGGARAQGANKGDSSCDIGAYEYDSTQTPTAITLRGFSARSNVLESGVLVIGLIGIALGSLWLIWLKHR